MEHDIDELLDGCGLTRTNIIYSGGGHCYLLLPSTAAVQQTLADWNRAFNGWLNEQFGLSRPGQRLDPLQCQRPVQRPRRGKPLQGRSAGSTPLPSSTSSTPTMTLRSCRYRVQAIPLQTSRTPHTSSLAAAPASSPKRSVTLT